MSKKVLVTGGSGFIGSHLCERLVALGHKVTCIDNLMSGRSDNVSALVGHPSFKFIEADVTAPLPISADKGDYDWIFNLASPASPKFYQSDPEKTLMTNVLGTQQALQLAERTGARLLQASTSEVYGDPNEHPQPESYWGNVNPIGPRACYDEGKRAAETLCFDYDRHKRADVRIARIFNTYGPRMAPDDGRVISNFVVQALHGKPLTIYGSGAHTRSFCYVDDLVNGFLALMAYEGPQPGPVNLGNPTEYTIKELAELAIELTGSRSVLSFKELPEDDPKQRRPVIDKARRLLKTWAPTVHIREGLPKTIDYFRSAEGMVRIKAA